MVALIVIAQTITVQLDQTGLVMTLTHDSRDINRKEKAAKLNVAEPVMHVTCTLSKITL